MSGQVNISGTINNVPQGTQQVGPFSIAANTDDVLTVNTTTIQSGENEIGIPGSARGCLFIPPTSNTQALTLKGVSGDTGITISPTSPTLLTFPTSPQASFYIESAGDTDGVSNFMFF